MTNRGSHNWRFAGVAALTFVSLAMKSPTLTPARAQGDKVRVLMVMSGSGGESHNPFAFADAMEKVLAQAGGFEVKRLAPPADKPGDQAHLAKLSEVSRKDYDVLLFYTVFHKLTPEALKAVQTFVEEGGGLVGLHATAAFGGQDEWWRLIGGRFTGHAPGTVPLLVGFVDPKHPIVAGLGELSVTDPATNATAKIKGFAITDEEYTYAFPAGVNRQVIGYFVARPPNTVEKRGNNDILWTIDVGKGRVFYSGLGHDNKVFANPSFLKVIAQGIAWSAGKPREIAVTK